MQSLLSIGGVVPPAPTSFKITSYNLTKSRRVASGAMAMDFIAKKTKLECKWEILSGTQMKALMAVIDGTNMFIPCTYDDNGTLKTITVYVGEIPRELVRRPEFRDGEYWWTNYEVHFIEQ